MKGHFAQEMDETVTELRAQLAIAEAPEARTIIPLKPQEIWGTQEERNFCGAAGA